MWFSQVLNKQHEDELKQLEAQMDAQKRQTAAQMSACQATELKLQEQTCQLLQLQQELDAKTQQLHRQSKAQERELQVRSGNHTAQSCIARR